MLSNIVKYCKDREKKINRLLQHISRYCFSDVRNPQVLPHHEAKRQNIPTSEKEHTAEVDHEVTVIVDLANLKRRSEDGQAAINHHEDREVTDHEVDLEIGIWRNRVNTAVSVDDTERSNDKWKFCYSTKYFTNELHSCNYFVI